MIRMGNIAVRFYYIVSIGLVILFSGCGENKMDEDPYFDDYPYPEGKIYFTYPPVGLEGTSMFAPRGRVDVIPKPHGGAMPKHFGLYSTTTPIYAMADGQIIGAGKYYTDTPLGPLAEHILVIKYSTTLSVRYGHVGELSEKISAQMPPLNERSDNFLTIPISAGDTIAWTFSYSALDILLMDNSQELNYLYPEVLGPENRYSADLTEYYREPLRSAILEKCIREEAPRWGKVDYDVAGKIIGIWYYTGEYNDVHAQHLGIAYKSMHPSRIALCDGYANYDLGVSGTYAVLGNEPKPETIGPESGIIKYEVFFFADWLQPTDSTFVLRDISDLDDNSESHTRGTYLLQMLDEETLKIEPFYDLKPVEVDDFTSDARIYTRKPL